MTAQARPTGYLAAAISSIVGWCSVGGAFLIFLLVAGNPPVDDIGLYPIATLLAGIAGWPLAVCSCWCTLRARAYPHAVGTIGLLLVLLPFLFVLSLCCFLGFAMLASATPLAYGQASTKAAAFLWQ